MIRIGTRISPDWLERPDDLRFLKQIGVDYAAMVDTAGEAWKRSAAGLDWFLSVSKGDSPPLPDGFKGPQGHDVERLIDSLRNRSS